MVQGCLSLFLLAGTVGAFTTNVAFFSTTQRFMDGNDNR